MESDIDVTVHGAVKYTFDKWWINRYRLRQSRILTGIDFLPLFL